MGLAYIIGLKNCHKMQSGGSGESNLVIQKLYPGSGMLVPDDIFFYLKVAS